jgi:hypothetical protein
MHANLKKKKNESEKKEKCSQKKKFSSIVQNRSAGGGQLERKKKRSYKGSKYRYIRRNHSHYACYQQTVCLVRHFFGRFFLFNQKQIKHSWNYIFFPSIGFMLAGGLFHFVS